MHHQSGGFIADDFIQSILEKTDIVQLIHNHVPLKKAGTNYVACCPFHQEKSPSFTVTPSKQFYHCFGCGANGDAISFIRAFLNLNFIEAVEYLANQLGVELPKQARPQQQADPLTPYSDILDRVALFYQHQLKHHQNNQAPIQYLKGRGLQGITAKVFRLGYAPSQWDNLVQAFHKEPDMLKKLETLGLIIKHQKGHYFDRFRNRIMFPIRTRKGQVIGFGGRSIVASDNPKYMNSPESVVFKKGQHLYGHYEAQQNHREWKTALCVEGYFDVIGLYEMGIMGAFAPMGTALTEQHIKRLLQLSDDIIFCFDGDFAGRQAAWKALTLILPLFSEQKRVKFLFLPDGEDPDSYCRAVGKEAFLKLLSQSLSLSEYFFSTLCDRYPPDNVENRAELIRTGRQYIEKLPKGTYHSMMLEALAQLTSTSQQIVSKKYAFLSKGKYQKGQSRRPSAMSPPPLLGPAYIASGILMSDPSLIHVITKQPIWEMINVPGLSLFKALMDILEPSSHKSAEQIMASLVKRGFTRSLIQQCISKIKYIPVDGMQAELLGTIERLNTIGREQLIENIQKIAQQRELESHEKDLLKKILNFTESSGNNTI